MPNVNRKPEVITAATPLPTGKTPGDWQITAAPSSNAGALFYNQTVADPSAAVIPNLAIGTSYRIVVKRLATDASVLASIQNDVVVGQLPGDPLFDAPVSFTLAVA